MYFIVSMMMLFRWLSSFFILSFSLLARIFFSACYLNRFRCCWSLAGGLCCYTSADEVNEFASFHVAISRLISLVCRTQRNVPTSFVQRCAADAENSLFLMLHVDLISLQKICWWENQIFNSSGCRVGENENKIFCNEIGFSSIFGFCATKTLSRRQVDGLEMMRKITGENRI